MYIQTLASVYTFVQMDMKLLLKPVNYIKEVKMQLTKVSWPTKDELIGATLVVITITILTATFIGIVDLIFSRILRWIFR